MERQIKLRQLKAPRSMASVALAEVIATGKVTEIEISSFTIPVSPASLTYPRGVKAGDVEIPTLGICGKSWKVSPDPIRPSRFSPAVNARSKDS